MAAKPEQLVKNKQGLADLMQRRFFVTPAFEIYGGTALRCCYCCCVMLCGMHVRFGGW